MAALQMGAPTSCSGSQLRSRHAAAFGPSTRLVRVRVQSGRAEPFNESAAQVKRLINRDRKEFLGNDEDILDKYNNEFDTSADPPTVRTAGGDAPVKPSTYVTATLPKITKPAAPAVPSNPFASTSASSNPFGAPSAPAQPFRSNSAYEPVGLRPDMGPDPITKEKGFNLFENITLTQVVLVMSFSLIIALMFATCYFVFSVGGIRLNGV